MHHTAIVWHPFKRTPAPGSPCPWQEDLRRARDERTVVARELQLEASSAKADAAGLAQELQAARGAAQQAQRAAEEGRRAAQQVRRGL